VAAAAINMFTPYWEKRSTQKKSMKTANTHNIGYLYIQAQLQMSGVSYSYIKCMRLKISD